LSRDCGTPLDNLVLDYLDQIKSMEVSIKMKKNLKHQLLVKTIIVFAVIAIIAVATVPKSFAQSIPENEKSAIAALRAFAVADGTYRAQTGIFAQSGLQLIKSGLLDNDIACFIPSPVCNQRGYIYTYTASPQLNAYFDLVAVPIVNGVTGTRSFYINERGIIYYGSSTSSPNADAVTRVVSGGLPFINVFPNRFDLHADGRSDVSVFRPSNATWFLQDLDLPPNYTTYRFFRSYQYGLATDRLVPADYNGDGRTDYAVYRDGIWYSNYWFVFANRLNDTPVIRFGESNDTPVPANFDADGVTDVAVYRPSNGTWYVNKSTGGITATELGQADSKPVAADFDGDGLADMAVFQPSTGIWQILQTKDGLISFQFGTEEDRLVVADYDGDGRADIGVYRPSNGFWYLQQSQAGFAAVQFGDSTDLPVPADYDGDGSADIAVYRSGTWFIQQSTAGFKAVQYGLSDDLPIASAYVR
jgi:hypothetical protein